MTPRRPLVLFALFAAVLPAAFARSGDPIPDIDIVLEQIPGATVKVDSRAGGFDEVAIEVGKPFAEALSAVRLPAGWTLEAKGKSVRLAGPAVPSGQPVRLVLDAGTAPRPQRISYQVRLDGRTLLRRKDERVHPVPPHKVIGSLQGIVTVPSQVAPGEPVRMRVSEGAALPPGGTWRISGVVVDEPQPEEAAGRLEAEPQRRRVALVVSAAEAGRVPDQALRDVAAVLAASRAPAGEWEVTALAADDEILDETGTEVWAVGMASTEPTMSNASKARHETAKSSIRNIKAMAAPAGNRDGGGGGRGGYGVRPIAGGEGALPRVVLTGIHFGVGGRTGEPPIPTQADAPDCDSPQDSQECCLAAGGGWGEADGGFCLEKLEPMESCFEEEDLPPDPELAVCAFEGFSAAERPEGGRVHVFDLHAPPVPFATVSTSRSNLKKTAVAETSEDGTVTFDLPDDLVPGGGIALQYVDLYGDVVVDVPSVPGVEVVEPAADGVARILDATPLASAGQQACVCGVFPGPEAWNRLLLDGEALGPPVSASSRMAWVTLPADAVLGPHVVAGAPEPGFPADDRATIVVVTIGGEIDSQKLQRLETTPLRLWVEGTSEPVELRLRNETPSIISIDGGDDQRILTTGGEPNQLERTVRGLSPGAFDIQYELTGAACPCATADAHYW